jgi:YD repeat-containing protein
MLQALDEEGRKTSYVYASTGPAAGFLVETRHEISSGNVEVYGVSVDALGRITSESAPWGSTGSRTYNAWDLVATSTTPSGATTTYSYDGNGRPTLCRSPEPEGRWLGGTRRIQLHDPV